MFLFTSSNLWTVVRATIGGQIGYSAGNAIFTYNTVNGQEVLKSVLNPPISKPVEYIGKSIVTLATILEFANLGYQSENMGERITGGNMVSFNEAILGIAMIAMTHFALSLLKIGCNRIFIPTTKTKLEFAL